MKTKSRIAGTIAAGAVVLGTYVGSETPAEATAAPTGGDASSSRQTFKNQAHGDCMDDQDGMLWQRTCTGSKSQQWDVMKGSNHVSLYNADTGYCLNDRSSGLGTRYCAGGDEQYFTVLRWNDGTISFKSWETGQCVDVTKGGNMGTRTCDKSKSQSWY